MKIKFTEYCTCCGFYNYRYYPRKDVTWAMRSIGTNGKKCQNCNNKTTWRVMYTEIPTSPEDKLKITRDQITIVIDQLNDMSNRLKSCLK
jgi:hypothetical protein